MSTTTVRIKASEIYKDWHVIDAAGRPLGRVASEAARLLRGKHKPTFEPHLDDGDFVIIVNASKVTLSGAKEEQMRYYRHTGYPGGLRTRTFTEQMDRSPRKVLEKAVWGMLPKGPLGEQIIRHLKVYPGPDHPHKSQITGSERAKAAREAAAAEALKEPRKVRRLRPLSVPQVTRDTETAAPKARKSASPAKAKPEIEGAPAAEEEVTPTPIAEEVVEEVEEEAAMAKEAAAEEKPKRTRARKADTAESTGDSAEAPAEEKPKRTRARKTTEAKAETEGEEAPKPRRSRAKKTEETESEGEES